MYLTGLTLGVLATELSSEAPSTLTLEIALPSTGTTGLTKVLLSDGDLAISDIWSTEDSLFLSVRLRRVEPESPKNSWRARHAERLGKSAARALRDLEHSNLKNGVWSTDS